MEVKKLKMAVKNMSAYLEECHDESDTITLTAKVLKSIKENYEELIKFKSKADVVEVVKCKDCIHKVDLMGRVMCNRIAVKKSEHWQGLTATDNEHYCSYGERRETNAE